MHEYGIWLDNPDGFIVSVAKRSFPAADLRCVARSDLIHEGRQALFLYDVKVITDLFSCFALAIAVNDPTLLVAAVSGWRQPYKYVTRSFWAVRLAQDRLLVEYGRPARWTYERQVYANAVHDDPDLDGSIFARISHGREEDPLDRLIRLESEELNSRREEDWINRAREILLDHPRAGQGEKDLSIFETLLGGGDLDVVAEQTHLKRSSANKMVYRVIERLRVGLGIDVDLPITLFMNTGKRRRSSSYLNYQRQYYLLNKSRINRQTVERRRRNRGLS